VIGRVAGALLTLLLQDPPVSGDARIEGGGIVLKTTSRLAGAIDSLTWNGKEFIDSFDHGRQLQSASSFGDIEGEFHAETFNPTEAGSRDDGRGPRSTSVLLRLTAAGNTLETRTRMAFWLKPGQTSEGTPARNTTPLSEHVVGKKVTIGSPELPHVLEYRVEFTVPRGEKHGVAQFEALTGYMPAEFSTFFAFHRESGTTVPLSDGPGEQTCPIIFSTESGSHAMGIWSADPHASYGRWRFNAEKVVKWNLVFRSRAKDGILEETYRFTPFVAVGSLAEVTASLRALDARR
jgi:hypothetical protein